MHGDEPERVNLVDTRKAATPPPGGSTGNRVSDQKPCLLNTISEKISARDAPAKGRNAPSRRYYAIFPFTIGREYPSGNTG